MTQNRSFYLSISGVFSCWLRGPCCGLSTKPFTWSPLAYSASTLFSQHSSWLSWPLFQDGFDCGSRRWTKWLLEGSAEWLSSSAPVTWPRIHLAQNLPLLTAGPLLCLLQHSSSLLSLTPTLTPGPCFTFISVGTKAILSLVRAFPFQLLWVGQIQMSVGPVWRQ